MSDAATLAASISDAPENWERALCERQIAMLGEIAVEGLRLIKALGRQVEAAQEQGARIEPTVGLTYAKLARAVRLTLMLQDKLIKAVHDRGRHLAWLAAGDTVQAERQRKTRVKHIVERVAARECDTWNEVERLVREASERLDQDDLYGGVLNRPVSELIAMICKDLGLEPDWSLLVAEAWAQEEIADGVAGWPLKAGADPNPPPSPIGKDFSEDPRPG